MDRFRINIAVLESSDIIYEGLSNILMKSDEQFYLYRLNELEDLNRKFGDIKFNIAIINPFALQNKKHEFSKLKSIHPELIWIGLVYTFFEPGLLSILDDTFSVTDPADIVLNKLNNVIRRGDSISNRHEQLSERETEVLVQLIRGLSHKEIADKLNISSHTVTSHRKNIIEKTGIKSLSGLTIYAITKKIIPLDMISPYSEG